MSYSVKIIEQDDKTATIGGYGVVFGGVDLDGDTFTKDTDFWSDRLGPPVVLYQHGADNEVKSTVLGTVSERKMDDAGLWVEAQLALNAEYTAAILELIEKGALGWSSGAIGHLVSRDIGGGKSIIKSWPIAEISLTPTPAEPRTLGVERVKTLATFNHSLEALTHEAGSDHPASDATVAEDEPGETTDIKSNGDKIMSDNAPTTVAGADLILDAIKGVADKVDAQAEAQKALDTRLAAIENKPAPKKGGYSVEDEADRALKGKPFKTFGELLMSVKDAGQGSYDKRLLPLKSSDPMNEGGYSVTAAMGDAFVGSLTAAKAAKSYKAAPTGLGESSGPTGGYLVDSDRAPGILSRVYESGQLLSRVAMDPVGPNANGMTYYAEAETSRADGSRRGGVRFYWVAENSAITSSNPTFRAIELKLRKAAALVYATDEQLADTAALESYVMRILPEEIRYGVEDAIINGLGTGQPLGILNSNAVVSVAKETGQAAATLVAENVLKMWARLWSRSQRNAVWLISQDVQAQLWQMNLPVGTGGQLVFVPPGGLSASPYGTLFGRPVIVHESCPTLGTVGDILLVDPMEYQMIEKGGIESASSIHVRFTQGEQVFRFIYRVDGQPTWNAALTPKNAGDTVSPFISLATRA